MKLNKILSFFLCVILFFNLLIVPLTAITPRWESAKYIKILHSYENNTAYCSVDIIGYVGTTKIENVDIKLWKVDGNTRTLINSWNDLSSIGSSFDFDDSVTSIQIQPGNTYRLSVTADIYYNGTVEQITESRDTNY